MSNLEGVMLSDYLLLECISRGNVADIYRALQNDASQYEVAVKIFRPGYAEREAFRTYFMCEAEKIGRFDHPHILPFIEYGEGEGLLYAVTPFVKSGTLEDLLTRVGGKFSAMQALPIMQQLCDAAQYAHEQGVIHGNIKPGNVFVARDGRMLLADFGIARSFFEGQPALESVDWAFAEYAAPEQSLGLLRSSSDIYTLGVLCFRLLTGSPLFTGTTPVEVLLKHVRQDPPSARLFDENISDAVAEVLRKALSKRADDRYSSARALSAALAAAVALAPVASPVARSVSSLAETPSAPSSASTPLAAAPLTSILTVAPVTVSLPPTSSAAPLQFDSTGVIELPPELQQSGPQPSLLPEQHGGTASAFAHSNQLPASEQISREDQQAPTLWIEPVQWSALAQPHVNPGTAHVASAQDNLSVSIAQPAARSGRKQPLPGERKGRKSLFLPILVVILLLLGLIGAILSSFFLSAPKPGAGRHTPAAQVAQMAYQTRAVHL